MSEVAARALAALQAGRAAEAEALLRASAATVGDVAALQILGAACSAQGRHEAALEAFERAARLQAPTPALLHNRAQAHFHLGRLAEARADLERALGLDAALHPAWNLLGAVFAQLGDGARAESAYDKAVALRPGHPPTHYNRAFFMHGAGRLGDAIRGYRQALQLDPGFAAARGLLVDALNAAGLESYRGKRHAQAIESYAEALALDPSRDDTRNSMGGALAALGRFDEAAECFRAVCARAPGNADAISNLGYVLQARGEIAAAAAEYRRALAIQPDHADALSNLGSLMQEEGRIAEAAALYRRALEADPDAAIAGYNLGILQLNAFDFAGGWELNERRYRTVPPIATARQFDMPQFGADDWGRGQRIALWGEQGVGDRLVYSTLVPELEARGERFVLETDARLAAAYRRAHPHWEVVAREDSAQAFASCTRHIALAGLPRLLRPSLQSFDRQPAAVLAADSARAAAYRARLEAPGRLVIGISWRSFQAAARGALQRKKSAPLQAFLALSRRSDLRLLDLQYGDTAEERSAFAAQGGELARLDDLDLFNDLDGVLAAIAACDAVLTTSNVTAHLAGALGKRTLLIYLAARPAFHYWATDSSGRSLWYPSMRIVTGPGVDSWEKALEGAAALIGA